MFLKLMLFAVCMCFPGERTCEAAHRLIQLFHQCRGMFSWWEGNGCYQSEEAQFLSSFFCFLFFSDKENHESQ